MSAFKDDLAENMKNPEFAYEYGRTERELEIVKLLEEQQEHLLHLSMFGIESPTAEQMVLLRIGFGMAKALIKGENE